MNILLNAIPFSVQSAMAATSRHSSGSNAQSGLDSMDGILSNIQSILNIDYEAGMKNFSEAITENFKDVMDITTEYMAFSVAVVGGLGVVVLAAQVGIQVIGAYAQAYLKHYIGRPKLAQECQFENRMTRIAQTLATPYTFAMKQIYGEVQNKKTDRPIFKEEIEKQISKIEKMTRNSVTHGGYLSHVLLYGPPGTGKTMISKYIAKEAGTNYIMMSGGELPQYIKRGEHVSELNTLFAKVKCGSKPTIIFIDEAEGLTKRRDKMSMERVELLNSFLNHTGEASEKFMLILATNRPEDLDPAVLSRMDNQIYIGPPEREERHKILKMNIEKLFKQEELFTEEYLNALTDRLDGFTGRDISKLCNMISVSKSTTDDNILTTELIEETLEQFISNRARIQKQIDAA